MRFPSVLVASVLAAALAGCTEQRSPTPETIAAAAAPSAAARTAFAAIVVPSIATAPNLATSARPRPSRPV